MSTLKVNSFQNTSGEGFYPSQAWVHWDSIGTVAIDDSVNISTITDNGAGNFNLNFSNNMANATYVISGAAGGEMNNYSSRVLYGNTFSTSSTNVRVHWQPANAQYDCNHNCAVIHGD